MKIVQALIAAFFGFLASLGKKTQKKDDEISNLNQSVANLEKVNIVQKEQLKVASSNVNTEDAYAGLKED